MALFSYLLRNALLIIFAHAVFLTPVLYFSDGFFLRRVEFPDKSLEHGKPVYKRAAILLIDALSFTFAKPINASSSESDSEYYANKLTVFQDMLALDAYANKVRLYKFLADPPTTTMQRIKALSTGSLSTFIEIAANFFSSEIHEDSWIYQSNASGNGVVALGDDTWGGLFPRDFKRSFLFPSFNVKDLDTVDNGVLEHLDTELKSRDWSVLLAHFLGVDHCGHTFGRNHPEMTRKLKQMDGVIRKTIAQIDEDTILFVFGDHGMTANGDHGGDSELEIASALFVYAPKHNFSLELPKDPVVYQTDFIPTLSLMMGWPVPFSSIGSLIDDFFIPSSAGTSTDFMAAYQANSRQLKTYFDKYFGGDNAGIASTSKEIDQVFQLATSKSEAASACLATSNYFQTCKHLVDDATAAHKTFHHIIRSTCETAWVKFNMTLVVGGLVGMVLAFAIILSIYLQIDDQTILPLWPLLLSILLLCIPLFILSGALKTVLNISTSDLNNVILLNAVLLFISWIFVRRLRSFSLQTVRVSWSSFLYYGLLLLPLLLGKFSNSYVIYEPFIILMLLNFFVLSRTWYVLGKLLLSLPGKIWRNLLSWPLNLYLFFTVCLVIVIRFQLTFLSCREEHGPPCEQSSFLSPLGSLVVETGSSGGSAYLSLRFALATASILVLPVYFRRIAIKRGNLHASTFTAWCYRYGLYLVALIIVIDWLLQVSTLKANTSGTVLIPSSVLILFPRVVYCVLAVFYIALIVNPLIFASKSESDLVAERFEDTQQIDPSNPVVMKTLFNFLKTKYDKGMDPNVPSLFVYGLGSVISTSWQLFYAGCILLVTMLCGDGLSPAICSIYICLWLFYKLEVSTGSGLTIAVMIHLMQNLAFYVTGHHATWTHIKWEAAFVGFDSVPDFFAIPGALILTNTYAGNVVTILSIPLFVLWPVVEMNCLPGAQNKKKTDENSDEPDDEQAECGFIRQPQMLANPLIRICLVFVLSTAIEVVVSSLAAIFLRRHLMAYKIFVPRLIFSILSFIYNFVLLMAVACLPVYVLRRLIGWKNSIDAINK